MPNPHRQDAIAGQQRLVESSGDAIPAPFPAALKTHDADLARLLRAAADLHLAATEEEALRIVCAAMRDTGWGRTAAYAYTPEWTIAAAAFAGMTPEEERELRNSRATREQRRAMFGVSRAPFLLSRSYLIPAERKHELVDPPPVVPSRQPGPAARTSAAGQPNGDAAPDRPGSHWNPQDVAYTPLYATSGSPIGLVMYDDPASGRRPDTEAFRYIEFFADTAARVIERIRTTEHLRRTEYRLAALLESMPDVVFYEGGTRSQLISRNLQALLGIPADEVESSPEGLFGLLDPRDADRVRAKQAQWERDGARGTLITRARMRTAEGGFRWIEDRAVRLPGHGRDGGPIRAGVMIDVTEQVQTEEALREREARFHMVTLATRDAIYDWNIPTGRVWRNDAMMDIVGEIDTVPDVEWWRQRIHPDDRAEVEASLAAAIAGGGRNWEAEYRLRTARGGYAHVRDRGFIVRNEARQVVRLIGAMTDITGRKEAEQRQALMLRELDHRVKNNLAAVMVLAEQSLRAAPTLQHFERTFSGRLRALARTHEVLAQSHRHVAALESIVRQTLEPYTIDDPGRLMVDGEKILLPARMASPLALALNELATNAVKYGALSAAAGWVGVAWKRVDDPDLGRALRIEWSEHGGPAVTDPDAVGFGTRLIADEVRFQLKGRSEIRFEPRGVRCVILAPLDGPDSQPAAESRTGAG